MAWNDPGRDNKDNKPSGMNGKSQSPPDLEEALKRLRHNFRRLLGGGRRNSEPSGDTNAGGMGLGAILLVLLVLWVGSGIFIVAPAEKAAVLRFGQYVKTVGPGPHWIARFIHSKKIVNVEQVSNFYYTALMLNKDENIVSVSVAVQYRIGNLKDYLFNVVNPRESLQQATASSLRQVIGHTTLDEILTYGREKVRQEVSTLLKDVLKRYETGITVTDVVLQPAKAPEQVKAAFDDAIKAQEDEQRFVNQAQAYTARVEPIAEGQAKRILEEAEAYKKQIILNAEGRVAQFLALLSEYSKAPIVTRERLYLDALQSVLNNTTKVVVDVKEGNNILYLPLDRLLQDAKKQQSVASTVDESSTSQSTEIDKILSSQSRSTRLGRDSYRGRGGY